MSVIWTETITPFGSSGNAPGELFENDIVVVENAPGVVLNGTEPNNVWAEYREVGGDSFLVTNASYITSVGWTQQNPSAPSYALVFRSNGEVDRLYAAPGAVAPLAWTTIVSIDPFGNFSSVGLPLTNGTQKAFNVSPTWNAGSTLMTAFLVAITDNTSNSASLAFNITKNGTSVFSITKNGLVSFSGTGSQSNPGSTSLPGGVTQAWGFQAGVAADGTADTTITYAAAFPTGILNVSPSIDTGATAGTSALTLRSFAKTRTNFGVRVSGGAPGATCTVSFIAIGY
jgi:hypothetical protein